MLSFRLASLNANGLGAQGQEGRHGYFTRDIRAQGVAVDQAIPLAEVGELDRAMVTWFHLDLFARDGVLLHRSDHHAPDALLLLFPKRRVFLLAFVLPAEHGWTGKVRDIHFFPVFRDAQLPLANHEKNSPARKPAKFTKSNRFRKWCQSSTL